MRHMLTRTLHSLVTSSLAGLSALLIVELSIGVALIPMVAVVGIDPVLRIAPMLLVTVPTITGVVASVAYFIRSVRVKV